MGRWPGSTPNSPSTLGAITSSTRWLSTLFADKVLKRYNTDDVIIKQGSATWGSVFLVLTGYCEVIHHDGERFETLASREAGDLMGEMAVVTGRHLRNAGVVARTPVMACEFSETAFDAFVVSEGLKEALLARWARRRVVGALPQFAGLSTVVIDTLCSAADLVEIAAGESGPVTGAPYWGIVVEGEAEDPAGGPPLIHGSEFGAFVPHAAPGAAALMTREGCTVLCIAAKTAQGLVTEIPQLNYRLRSYRESRSAGFEVWQLTAGSTN